MDDKLQEIEHKFERLEADLGDPGVLSDQARYRQTTKERSQLEPLVGAFRELKRVRAEVAVSQLWVASSQASVITGKIASAIAYWL